MRRFSRIRTVQVATLDRQMAEAEAIGRVVEGGTRWARVIAAERKTDPVTDSGFWEIVLKVSRRLKRPP